FTANLVALHAAEFLTDKDLPAPAGIAAMNTVRVASRPQQFLHFPGHLFTSLLHPGPDRLPGVKPALLRKLAVAGLPEILEKRLPRTLSGHLSQRGEARLLFRNGPLFNGLGQNRQRRLRIEPGQGPLRGRANRWFAIS